LMRGLLMVYTGGGKGKTTAALGMALRSLGHKRKVIMIQFMKGPGNVYGETLAAEAFLPDFRIEKYGRDVFVNKKHPHPDDLALARQGFERAREALSSGEWDLVILDELNVAADFGLLNWDEVLPVLASRHERTDVVVTGRNASGALIDMADMVTEVKEIKHPYRAGIPAKKGVEF